MGPIALPPNGADAFAPATELAVGPAEMVAAIALAYSLAGLYLLGATDVDEAHERTVECLLQGAILPLAVTFGATILFTTITLL